MHRRDFLKASCAAATTAWLGAAENAVGDWPSDLAAHRIAKIETIRSQDRYTRSLGPNSKRGPHGRGYARPFRTVTTDQGAVGFAMCWGPDERITPFIGAKVGDLFDPDEGTDDEAFLLDYVLHDLAGEDLIDVCIFDIGTLGYTRWRRAMPIFKQAGILAAPHLWGCTPKPLYCAHLAAGVGNVLIVEGIPGVGQHLDYSRFKIADGKIHVTDTPGFGIVHRPGPGVGPSTA